MADLVQLMRDVAVAQQATDDALARLRESFGLPAAGVGLPAARPRFDDDWAPNPNDDQGRPNDPLDDLTPGADSTDRAGAAVRAHEKD